MKSVARDYDTGRPANFQLIRLAGDRNALRSYEVYVDGSRTTTIAPEQTVGLKLSSGEHTLRLKIDWVGSRTVGFSVQAGSTATFYCRTSAISPGMALFDAMFRHDRFVELRETLDAFAPQRRIGREIIFRLAVLWILIFATLALSIGIVAGAVVPDDIGTFVASGGVAMSAVVALSIPLPPRRK